MKFVYIVFNLCYYLLHYDYNNTHTHKHKQASKFVVSLTPGASISGIIFHKDLSQKRTRSQINDYLINGFDEA